MNKQSLKITRNVRVGALDAETDSELLDRCFVDKGYINELMDVNKPTSIILGRTGSGKSALIYKINSISPKSVLLDPNDISIRFLEHSDIIQFFDALNINLDLFYRLLWRHLLTVEFLKLRYDIKSEIDSNNMFSGILGAFSRDNTKKKAVEYFKEWGDKFWLDTDEQLKEITQKLERDTKASVGQKYSGLKFTIEGLKKLSDQQRTEVRQRASQVVSSLQIKKLTEVLELLSEHSFDDQQKNFYILIDQLDEEWANTETRCRFIRALIEEVKTFRKIEPVKIIIALRKDLLDIVFDKTRDSGFQEEKYESYILDIRWSTGELENLIELRINEVFKSQYTGQKIVFDDLFPSPRKKGGQTAINFILERTLRRPRDILQFVNESFNIAADRDRISWRALQAAEAQYSLKRLKSLKEEWGEVYPSFDDTVEILRGLDATFTRSSVSDARLEEIMLQLYHKKTNDPCVDSVKRYYDEAGVKESEVLSSMLSCLYRLSVIGIKISTLDTFVWSYIDQASISSSEIKRANKIKIHKMLYRALDVVVDQTGIYAEEDMDMN